MRKLVLVSISLVILGIFLACRSGQVLWTATPLGFESATHIPEIFRGEFINELKTNHITIDSFEIVVIDKSSDFDLYVKRILSEAACLIEEQDQFGGELHCLPPPSIQKDYETKGEIIFNTTDGKVHFLDTKRAFLSMPRENGIQLVLLESISAQKMIIKSMPDPDILKSDGVPDLPIKHKQEFYIINAKESTFWELWTDEQYLQIDSFYKVNNSFPLGNEWN